MADGSRNTLPKRPLARSNELPDLRRLLEAIPGFILQLPFRLVVVVDTNVIYAAIVHRVEKQRNPDAKGDLMESLEAGVLVALLPPGVAEEVREKLLLRAAERGAPPERYLAAWEILRPLLVVVALWRPIRNAERFLRDPDDAPQILLQEHTGADGVLTRDKDIAGMDGRALSPEDVLRAAKEYARASAVRMRVETTAVAASGVGTVAAFELTKALIALAKAYPRLALAAGAVMAGAAIAIAVNPKWRAKVCGFVNENAAPLLEFWQKDVAPVVAEIATEYRDAVAQAHAVEGDLHRRGAFSAKRRTVRQNLIAALAAERAPLTFDALDAAATRGGYRAARSQRRSYLRRVLRSAPFGELANGRFQLRTATAT